MACVKGIPDCGDPHFLAVWVKECSPLRPAVASDFFYSNSTFCEETLMADNKRCAHPSCTCPAAADSKYCSTECAAMEKTPDVDCRCGHAGCGGKTH